MSERAPHRGGKHRQFWDNAGYRCHCWECVHSHNWTDQDDETLAEHGMVRLPVDADGETWHIGDAYTLKRDQSHEVCNVSWMTWGGDRWEVDGEAVEQLVRYGPTPAERIRKCIGRVVGCYKDHGTLDAAVLYDLRAIADELEGDK